MNNYGVRALGREITDEYGVVDRIVQESQDAVMAVRMMPVGQVFQRFPRLVRDLARKLGKQVDLVITGKETEAENNVIESLFCTWCATVSTTVSSRRRNARQTANH